MAGKKAPEERPIVIKKIKRGGHGHHGGAWKVAYADFVTAMMAFFLLMWLLNATTEEQKKGIADFFDPTPTIVSDAVSGAGGVMGGLTVAKEGSRSSDVQPFTPTNVPPTQTAKSPEELTDEQLERERMEREEQQFAETKRKIEEAVENSDLKDLAKNLKVDMTPEGLRIQIVDQDGASMFPSGSAQPFEKTQKLLSKVAEIIRTLPNEVSVRGHTDGAPYGAGSSYTNWELSADRANSSRRVLEENGIPSSKLANVVGKADTDHFVKANPMDPQNRRISIILLRDSVTKGADNVNATDQSSAPPDDGRAYRPTSGAVQFP